MFAAYTVTLNVIIKVISIEDDFGEFNAEEPSEGEDMGGEESSEEKTDDENAKNSNNTNNSDNTNKKKIKRFTKEVKYLRSRWSKYKRICK